MLILAAALGSVGYWVSKKSHQGPAALDFHLTDFQGKMHDFELERAGNGVFVHFWASWCPPCLKEMPEFNQFVQSQSKNPNRQFWLISVDETEEAALGLLNKYQWPPNVKLLFDPNRTASRQWGTFDYPETYLLRLKDLKRTKWIGTRNWSNPKYLQEIADFLEEK